MAMTRYENYLEAVKCADEALEAYSNAVHHMRAAKVEAQAGGYRRPDERELESDLESLVKDLKTVECDNCGEVLAKCACAWLQEKA
jgi:hypothetical protein